MTSPTTRDPRPVVAHSPPGAGAPRRGPTPGVRRAAAAVALVALAAGAALVALGLRGRPAEAPLSARTFSISSPAHADAAAQEVRTDYPADRLVVESLGIDAPLVPERVDAAGELVVPGAVDSVGLWADGPGLSARSGTTVLAGHVDRSGDLGALHPLYRIEPGAAVVVTDARARITRWRVVQLRVVDKDALPDFGAPGPRRLAIVTCGGAVVDTPGGRRYASNVIAVAEPEGSGVGAASAHAPGEGPIEVGRGGGAAGSLEGDIRRG